MTGRRAGGPFVYGYAHLALYPALAAVGVGVKLAIEAAIGSGRSGHAAAVLGLGVAGYVVSLSAIHAAAPRRLRRGALSLRGLLVLVAVGVAVFEADLEPAALSVLIAVAALVPPVFELRGR